MEKKQVLLAAALMALNVSIINAEEPKAKTTESTTKEVEGQCMGANSCKGTSACHTQSNDCAGTNSCKGKGWIKATEKDCKEKKGTFKKSK